MLFWIVAGTLSALVALLVARPLIAPPPAGPEGTPDAAIYRDQLAEVDRDLARGLIAPAEAERARTEISRRLLAADRAGPARVTEAPRRVALAAAAVAGVLVVPGALLLYTEIGDPGQPDAPRSERLAEADLAYRSRPSQAEAEAQVATQRPDLPPPPADVQETIDQLRAAAKDGTADVDGLTFLGFVEERLGNLGASAAAQRQLIDLKGAEATTEDRVRLLDLMVGAAEGTVTPEAEALLKTLSEADPTSPPVLYYTGLLLGTTRRPDLAFPYWRALVERAPADDPYRQMALPTVSDLGWFAGFDYTPPQADAPGPSQADVANAADMTPEQRQEMIRGMVQSLSDRLATQGGPAEDWARLITSLGVLGEKERADAILKEARTTFASDPAAQRLLDDAAHSAGLAD